MQSYTTGGRLVCMFWDSKQYFIAAISRVLGPQRLYIRPTFSIKVTNSMVSGKSHSGFEFSGGIILHMPNFSACGIIFVNAAIGSCKKNVYLFLVSQLNRMHVPKLKKNSELLLYFILAYPEFFFCQANSCSF